MDTYSTMPSTLDITLKNLSDKLHINVILIVEYIHHNELETLGIASKMFIKDVEKALRVYMTHVENSHTHKDDYDVRYNKIMVKQYLYRIMTYIRTLLRSIHEALRDTRFTSEKRDLFRAGLYKLHTLKDDFIYLLRL